MSEYISTLELYINNLREIVEKAAIAVMEIYQKDFSIFEKQDKSPLTEADLVAHNIIKKGLAELVEFPILSEEGINIPWEERKSWSRYWLVDPIDGTKEFIKKNGEFTINIALIEHGVPVIGVVAVPALSVTYYGAKSLGAWKEKNAKGDRDWIKPNKPPKSNWKVVGSRSHNSEDAIALVKNLPGADFVSMGSSLKLCSVAEGKADLYPRFGPTSEWDTAAAQAVVEAAGGRVLQLDLSPLRYNTKESLLNPYFIVCSEVDPGWSDLIKEVSVSAV